METAYLPWATCSNTWPYGEKGDTFLNTISIQMEAQSVFQCLKTAFALNTPSNHLILNFSSKDDIVSSLFQPFNVLHRNTINCILVWLSCLLLYSMPSNFHPVLCRSWQKIRYIIVSNVCSDNFSVDFSSKQFTVFYSWFCSMRLRLF